MLSHLLDVILGFFVLGENCSGWGWFPNWKIEKQMLGAVTPLKKPQHLCFHFRINPKVRLWSSGCWFTESHLIFHPCSPWYCDLHVDVFKEFRVDLLLLSGTLHRRLHSTSRGRRRWVSRVCGSRWNTVQSADVSCAAVFGLLLLVIAGQDDWEKKTPENSVFSSTSTPPDL